MRDAPTKPVVAMSKMASAILALTVAAWTAPVFAQTASTPPAQSAATKAVPPTTTATAPQAGAPDDLPWLATTNPADPAAAKKPAGQPPEAAKPGAPKPADQPTKKTANAQQKCEDQVEDTCRGMKGCAWVAAIPTADGNVTPARCAERKVFAPEKEKKSKPAVASKPKPKPDSIPQQTKNEKPSSEPASVQSEVKPAPSEAKPEPKPETAAVPESDPPKIEAPQSPTPAAQAEAPAAQAAPADSVKAETAKAEAPLMLPRAPVPFLPVESPPEAPKAAPVEPPHSEATPIAPAATASVAENVASDAPAEEKQPLSIPGLVIVD